MKKNLQTFIFLLMLTSCGDKEYELHKSKRYQFEEGTILRFQSDASTEEFVVRKIVNGRYEVSRSGTCEKPPLDIYYYQAVHLRPLDTLDRQFKFVSALYTDCSGFPANRLLQEPALISSVVGTFQTRDHDMIQWLDEFKSPMSGFTRQHARLILRTRQINDVYEFETSNGKRLSRIYYTTLYGVVGYQLKNGAVFELANNLP